MAETDPEDDPLRTGNVRAAEAAEGRRGVVRGRFEGVSGAETPSSSSEADKREKATLRFALPGVLLASRRADFVGDADRDCGCEREGALIGVVVVIVVVLAFSFFWRISLIVARMDSFNSTHSSSIIFTRRENTLSDTPYLSTSEI